MRPIPSLLAIILVLSIPTVVAQTTISLLGHLDYQALRGADINSIWGYTDEEGHEYALVAVTGNFANTDSSGGLSIVDITDPSAPVEVFFLSGPYCTSYEAQVWGDRAYVTSRCGGGLRIIDLSPLPQSNMLSVALPEIGLITAHTNFIDEQGRLYLNGGNLGGGGVAMFDLAQDPDLPVFVGEYSQFYVHDCFARGDTLYAANINDGLFSILDVSDPTSPVLLATQGTPGSFTHNLWLDDSGDHLFTTDEVQGAPVGSFDIADLTDIEPLDAIHSGVVSSIPHNTYWLDSYLVTSYYVHGVVIYDAQRPSNLIEVGHYDTSPISNGVFQGAWGVYPFFASQRLIVSDMEAGLFILGPIYQRACWLEGTVTDAVSSSPVSQTSVTIVGTSAYDLTGFEGTYQTGYHVAGAYQVQVGAPGYIPQTIDGVVLSNGVLTLLDIQLVPTPTQAVNGTVVETGTGTPVEDALIEVQGNGLFYSTYSNSAGDFTIPAVAEGTYDMAVSQWGHLPMCSAPITVFSAMPGLSLELERGYYDDFALDLGWSVTGVADTGAWVRSALVGPPTQLYPTEDVLNDCGSSAYVTGSGMNGIDPFFDWIIKRTWLSSPLFDAGSLPDPHVRYARWFNEAFAAVRDDTLHVYLTDGVDTVGIETVTNSVFGAGTWRTRTFRIADHIQPGSTMRFILSAADSGAPNRFEAGLDRFEILPSGTTGVPEDAVDASLFTIQPNPNAGRFVLNGLPVDVTGIELHDIQGRTVWSDGARRGPEFDIGPSLAPGTYLLTVVRVDGTPMTQRMVVDR